MCFFLQDGKEDVVTSNEIIKIKNSPKESELAGKDCIRKNTGIYKITVENKHGKDDAELEIVILGKFISYCW